MGRSGFGDVICGHLGTSPDAWAEWNVKDAGPRRLPGTIGAFAAGDAEPEIVGEHSVARKSLGILG